MISRTGTGEDPDTVGVEVVAALLHPATLSTVTLMLPVVVSIPLMKTCRKPTEVLATKPDR